MFLTFEDYQEMGGQLEKPEFTQAEFVARQKINELTHNRIQDVTENIKMCTFGLIERGYLIPITEQGTLGSRDVLSASANNISASYESVQGKAESFIRSCLSDTPNLFYAGF